MNNKNQVIASKLKRFITLVIDTTVLLLIRQIYILLLGDEISLQLDILVSIFMIVFYYYILEASKGITIGKWITRTKVVKKDGSHPEDRLVFFRSLFRLIPVDPFSFLWNNEACWHDTFSETIVVDTAKSNVSITNFSSRDYFDQPCFSSGKSRVNRVPHLTNEQNQRS